MKTRLAISGAPRFKAFEDATDGLLAALLAILIIMVRVMNCRCRSDCLPPAFLSEEDASSLLDETLSSAVLEAVEDHLEAP